MTEKRGGRRSTTFSKTRPPTHKVDDATVAKMRALRADGKTLLELMRQFKLCEKTVRKYVHGIIPGGLRLQQIEQSRVVQMAEIGMNNWEIARALQVTDSHVWSILKRHRQQQKETA